MGGSIKFLIDEDMPRSTARELRNSGYAAYDVRDVGLRGHSDSEVFNQEVTKFMSEAVALKKINYPYITRKEGVCGGKPIIAGTRIKVAQIAIEYDQMGLTSDEIIQAHPHLTLAQVHDALSYYYDNIGEIEEDIRLNERFVEAMKEQYTSILERKRGKN